MLKATETLLALMDDPRPYGTVGRLRDAYADVVRRFGGAEDREALLRAFLRDPARGEPLLWPICALGDAETGRRLLERCFAGGALRPGMPDALLHAVGYLGVPGVEEMLFDYARMEVPGADWGAHASAVDGLLNLPCDSIRDGIRAEVERCYGRNLFPEYVPALAFKTGDPALLEGIWTLGCTTASTDCNGGIILGIALYGEAGRPYFRRLMWDPYWEADSTATGSLGALYAGLQCLGMGVVDVHRELLARLPDTPHPRGDAAVMLGVLESWLAVRGSAIRGCEGPVECGSDVHRALFDGGASGGETLADTFRAAAARPGEKERAPSWERLTERVYALRHRVEQRIAEDALLEELAAARA